jgi:hypothetical protein
MKRAKSGGHKGHVKQVMSSHVDVEVSNVVQCQFLLLFVTCGAP